MKIRNGFISNSSSSSFIINYPKEEIRLSDIESYFGGYNSDIPTHLQDIMNFVLWRTQFDDEEYKISEAVRHECKLEKDNRDSFSWKCPKHFNYYHGCDTYDEDINPCKGCEYWETISEEDYIDSLINECYCSSERAKLLNNFKNNCGRIKYLEIEDSGDNDSALNLSYRDAYDIRRCAGDFFKSHDRIIEEEN